MWIKPFQAGAEFYLYSAWSNAINRVSPRLYRYFASDPSRDESRRVATALGLLPERTVPLQVFPEETVRDALARLRREGPARVVMTVTEACNFRCRYCVFSGAYPNARSHGTRGMSRDTAFKALRWYFGFPRAHYRLGFYGGEPLLQRRLIESVVEEARKKVPSGSRLSFAVTTNGWLLNDAAVDFLARNAFDLFVSLDGPARVHDRYRCTVTGRPTFDRVWNRISRIRERHPEYFAERVNLSMTSAPPDAVTEILAFAKENSDIFANKVPVFLTIDDSSPRLRQALGIAADESRADGTSLLREQYLSQLARGEQPDGLCRAANEAAMARFARRSMTSLPILKISGGQCVPGARCHVTPDGMLHACERGGQHFPIGNVDTGYDEQKIKSILERYGKLVRAHCADCWAVRLCPKCIVDLGEGPVLAPDRLSAICAGRLRELERDMIDFCRARSRDDHCFDDLVAAPADPN